MSQEIIINVNSQEVRVALVEDGVLQEIHIERSLQQGLLGNIYKGRVTRLMPGIQAAFVDIGLDRSAFLHVSDMVTGFDAHLGPTSQELDIRDYVRIGQKVLVQVYKDPIGSKGARLTTQFTIPSRYLVLTPNIFQISVSQKITDDVMRERLLQMTESGVYGGYIFRTAAEKATQEEINADKIYLDTLWKEVDSKIKVATMVGLVYEEIPILLRVLRDMVGFNVTRILVDDETAQRQMQHYAELYVPSLKDRIILHSENKSIFKFFSIEDEIQKALERKVFLPSGGHIVFDQTEAMTTIDINTGSYLGSDNIGEAILSTNLEAIDAIVRQVRLRNLGGIIIIDFIDMANPSQKEWLLQALTQALQRDTAKTQISELSSLGLVQMTRKRSRESLEHVLCTPCPLCKKRGTVKSIETICYEIFREIKNIAQHYPWLGFLVIVSTEIATELLNQNVLSELESQIQKPIRLQTESNYPQENYEILPLAE